MRFNTLIASMVVAAGVVSAAKAQPVSSRAPTMAFSETGLALTVPKGFERATAFHGLMQRSTGSSVMISVLPAPFNEASGGFNKEQLAMRGMDLRSKKSIQIAGQPGLLIHVALQAQGQAYLKWIAVFGDDEETRFVAATFPASHAEALSKPLQRAVLETKQTKGKRSEVELPFQIQTVDGLVRVKKGLAVGKMALFTKDGKHEQSSPADPIFIVGPSLGPVAIADRQEFAAQRLRQTADVTTIETTTKINIGGLNGFESVAHGRDRKSQTEILIYQTILFPEQGGYVLMQGLVGKKNANKYAPKFRRIARSYKSKK